MAALLAGNTVLRETIHFQQLQITGILSALTKGNAVGGKSSQAKFTAAVLQHCEGLKLSHEFKSIPY
jgi:hypothetical protein